MCNLLPFITLLYRFAMIQIIADFGPFAVGGSTQVFLV
jgi:hypothetical protein